MEVNEKALTEFKQTHEQEQKQQEVETQKQEFSELPAPDLSHIKPLIHRIHLLAIDILGYEPDDEMVKGLDEDAIKIIEYYAPALVRKNSIFISYFGTLGVVLMTSKNKKKSQKGNILEYKGKNKENDERNNSQKTHN